MKLHLAVTMFLIISGFVFSNSYAQEIDPMYTISDIILEEIDDDSSYPVMDYAPQSFEKAGGIGGTIATIEGIIALGEKIYSIIDKGRAVVSTNYAPIQVLPKVDGRAVDVLDTEGWSYPRSKKFSLTFINGFKQDMIKLVYSVNYSYGGSHNGKGQYLTGVQIVPVFVQVKWGVNLDVNFKLVSLTNHGSRENPLVGATLMLSYHVKNVFTNIQENISYHVSGDGVLRQL